MESVNVSSALQRFTVDAGELPELAINYVEEMRDTLVPWFMPMLEDDDFLLPMRRGRMIVIQARPGHTKTTFTLALAAHVGKKLREVGLGHRAPMFVTRETTVQDLAVYFMTERLRDMAYKNPVTDDYYTVTDFYKGRVPKQLVQKAGHRLAALGVTLMGQRSDQPGVDINIDTVWQAVQEKREEGQDPVFVVMDYAQRFSSLQRHTGGLNEDAAHVFAEVDQFCIASGTPVILLAQSRREVDNWDPPIGNSNSVHGSSNAEKLTDSMFALMKPSNVPALQEIDEFGDVPETFKTGLGEYLNHPHALVFRKIKQRGASSIGEKALLFDPATLTISEMPEKAVQSIDNNNLVNYSREELEQMSSEGSWVPGL